MSDNDSSDQHQDQEHNPGLSPIMFEEDYDSDSTTDADIIQISSQSSEQDQDVNAIDLPHVMGEASHGGFFEIIPIVSIPNSSDSDDDAIFIDDDDDDILINDNLRMPSSGVSEAASSEPTPIPTPASSSDDLQPSSSSVVNTGTETEDSSSVVVVGENQIGNRKRPGDNSGDTSARKFSRVVTDGEIPTSSRSVGGNKAGVPEFDSDNEESEDSKNCSICMDPYTNSGPHRICCLKCGHIFGHSCIQRWLVGQKSCPLCNARAIMSDIRLLFTKNLVALDSAELQRTKNELEKVKISKEKLNYELNRVKLALDMKEKELQVLKRGQSSNDVSSFNCTETEGGREQTFEGDCTISAKFVANVVTHEKDAGFRVGAYCEESGTLVVSQYIGNPLYPSGAFGIRIVKMYDTKFSNTKSVLHQRQIRDLCFAKYTDNTVLTCGIDRKAILSNIEQKVIIHTFNVPEPLWSCAWDSVNPNLFYVGSGNGRIMSYDVRSPKEIHSLFDTPLDNSPVARMIFTDKDTNYTRTGMRHNGLLIQHLNSIWYGQMENNTCEEYEKIPLEGPFTNMDYDPKTALLLVTTRSSKSPKEVVNLQNVYQLNRRLVAGDDLVNLEPIRTAELPRKNQILMTRSKIWSPYEDSTFPAAVATDWSEKEEGLWFPTTNSRSMYWKQPGDVVVDFVPANRGEKPFLISITTDKIRLVELNRPKRNR